MDSFVSTLILFFLVMNPLGNLPVFIAELDGTGAARYRFIVIRESLIALGVLLLFLFCGGAILKYLNLKALKQPSRYLFLGDSVSQTTRKGHYLLPTLASDTSKMYLIHGGRLNLLYADGHVASSGRSLSLELQKMGAQANMLMDESGALY